MGSSDTFRTHAKHLCWMNNIVFFFKNKSFTQVLGERLLYDLRFNAFQEQKVPGNWGKAKWILIDVRGLARWRTLA